MNTCTKTVTDNDEFTRIEARMQEKTSGFGSFGEIFRNRSGFGRFRGLRKKETDQGVSRMLRGPVECSFANYTVSRTKETCIEKPLDTGIEPFFNTERSRRQAPSGKSPPLLGEKAIPMLKFFQNISLSSNPAPISTTRRLRWAVFGTRSDSFDSEHEKSGQTHLVLTAFRFYARKGDS